MERYDIYRDIAQRCGGDIYIGVVGPVRTGKSTLISRLMELMVLPHMEEGYKKGRTVDELPQSGSGRTVMTTQPRFIPSEAVPVSLPGAGQFNVRLVDCVGYMVRGALGTGEEDGTPRMVRTPWADQEIPFADAAELGTRKVITDHSTIGVLVTTDGSIAGIPRMNYVDAEERVVDALKASGKPFVMVLNSSDPDGSEAVSLQVDLQEKYGLPVLLMDVLNLKEGDIETILGSVLYEFPLRTVRVEIPGWMQALDPSDPLISGLLSSVRQSGQALSHVRDYQSFIDAFSFAESEGLSLDSITLGEGAVNLKANIKPELFYRVLGEQCGATIKNDAHLMSLMSGLVKAKLEYDRLAGALESVRATGYGLVPPLQDELTLEEPELVKQNGRFGVRLKASGPSLHLMRVDIATEVSPIMGSEKESEELVKYLLQEFENDPVKIWDANMFGKSLSSLVEEGLTGKLMRMPGDVREKIKETLQRIINEGSGGVICILL
ncbi:MAG: stage IV sporulation protein A [Christensenellaceae bacterium]|jgi:stage IV sporulation protein A|nr:stage IV sporulation protein A [Christensenellaceae bacterium]